MLIRDRAILMCGTSVGAALLDLATKWFPHSDEAANYHVIPIPLLVGVALCLAMLGVSHSRTVAAGTGLMLGALAGNGGQLAFDGYATDWIPIAGWITNVADIAGAVGFLCCCVGYLQPLLSRLLKGDYDSETSDGGVS